MPQQTKNCACGMNDWISISTNRIESLGYTEVLWCKDCGTIKHICNPNGAPNYRLLDYRQPKNESKGGLQVIK